MSERSCTDCDHAYSTGGSSGGCDFTNSPLPRIDFDHPCVGCSEWTHRPPKPESMDQAYKNLLAKVDPLQAENEELKKVIVAFANVCFHPIHTRELAKSFDLRMTEQEGPLTRDQVVEIAKELLLKKPPPEDTK